MSVAAGVSLHERFQNAMGKRYFIRLHMTVMMALVLLAGLLCSRVLTDLGVRNMALRYPIAVTVSYLAFFGLIRLWTAYVARVSRRRDAGSGGSSSFDFGDVVPGNLGSGGSGGSGNALGQLVGGGGRSGGAGSSLSFAEGEGDLTARQAVVIPMSQSGGSNSSSGSSSSSGFSLDLDGDGVWLLVLFVVFVGAIFGAGVYLIYQAPAILSEAAFQVVLAPGLVKTARSAHEPGWLESVLKKTVIPFGVVLLFSGVFGFEAHKRCPGASTVRQVFSQCVFR